MAQQATQLTPEELIEAAARMSRRLSSALDRLDAGDLDTLDDIASIVRTAIGQAKGNDVIHRLCKQNHCAYPVILVGPAPENERRTMFSVGNVPSERSTGTGVLSSVSLREWQSAPAVVLKGNAVASKNDSARRVTSWHQLASDFGNTYGSHVSQTIPQTLTDSELYGVPGGKLDVYLLRAAAVVVEHALAEVLTNVGYKGELRSDHKFSPASVSFGGLTIYAEGDGEGFIVLASPSKVEEVRIVTVPLVGRRFSFWTVVRGNDIKLEFRPEPIS